MKNKAKRGPIICTKPHNIRLQRYIQENGGN